MSEIKVINLNNPKSKSKKNLYKEILSSSKTVKEIIKNKRFDYLNNYVKNNKLVNFNTPNSLPPLNKNVNNPDKINESKHKLRESKSKENENITKLRESKSKENESKHKLRESKTKQTESKTKEPKVRK